MLETGIGLKKQNNVPFKKTTRVLLILQEKVKNIW